MPSIVLATCTTWPDLSAGDAPLARALMERHGIEVRTARWNAAEDQPLFASADTVVLRSNWDYHHTPEAFAAWLGGQEAQGTTVFNQPALVRWNLDKRYLLDLAAKGAATPITRIVPPSAQAIGGVLDAEGWGRAVLKPSVGASGHNVQLIERGDDLASVLTELGLAASGREVM
ncbi:MAG TPA: hypothetical protein VFD32_02845, partial [Dehalococcoidia bacterium]|nr:hypothetical protein [Dehalococcoidia bacterium]